MTKISNLELVHTLLLAAISIASIICSYSLLDFVKTTIESSSFTWERRPEEQFFTYDGDDFPPDVDYNFGPPVEMIVEESVHYSMVDSDAKMEWAYHHAFSHGSVIRVGPRNRTMYIALFHQSHCISQLSSLLAGEGRSDWAHTHHCMNYLREWILCQADQTLELGDFMQRNYTVNREGGTYMCRNWENVFDYTTRDWLKWYKHGKELENGLPMDFNDF
ncbi:hypothetical protein BT96DRAFT_636940 [Gymnopus androsaceus JB14]|uniref:Oxidase ustYa n=1 Tax=Gymnopus androsaceus JB14 TaxID=1447944 RepID=A0A6A4HVA0_9AGAR|nr:hypothetical protein BT96DRAFT_636940 [Gymnopus androsaceus JB14]